MQVKSDDSGFDPLAGQGEGQCVWCVPPSQVFLTQTLFVPETPSRVGHAPKFVRTLKIPYPSIVKT